MTTASPPQSRHASRSPLSVLLALLALVLSTVAVPAPASAAMSVDQFVNSYNGRIVDFDGAYGGQCVDLIQFYNRDVVGAPRLTGNAKDIFGSASGHHYHKLGAGTAPAKGDIAVWGASRGGGYGHVGIVVADQGGSVRILSQNNHAPYAGNTATEIISMSKSGIIGYLRPKNLAPPAPAGHEPISHFDSVALAEPGRIAVRGWAFDRDDSGRSIDVHVYIGGPAGTAGAEGHSISANADRPDVNTAHGIGGRHGFDSFINTRKTGQQRVCAHAISIGGGNNTLIGCKSLTIPDPNPFGNYDAAHSPAAGTVQVRGWALDRSAVASSLAVHVYVGGEAGEPNVEVHHIQANVPRPDVNRTHGVHGDHGFDSRIRVSKTGPQKVCTYAINTGVGWNNTSLGCKTVTIETPPKPKPSPVKPAPIEPGAGAGTGSLGS